MGLCYITYNKKKANRAVRKALSLGCLSVKKENVTVCKYYDWYQELKSHRVEAVRFAGRARKLKGNDLIAKHHAWNCYDSGVSVPRSLRRFLKGD
jgi:hypothetical protein